MPRCKELYMVFFYYFSWKLKKAVIMAIIEIIVKTGLNELCYVVYI